MQRQVIIPVVLLIAFIISVSDQRYRFQKSGNASYIAASYFSNNDAVPPFSGVLDRLNEEIDPDKKDTCINCTNCVSDKCEGISRYTRNENNVAQYFQSRKNGTIFHYIITKSETENESAFETTKTGVIKCNSSQVDVSILESQYF